MPKPPPPSSSHARTLLAPFPEGLPYLSGGTGRFVNEPNRLPLLHLFHDYDLFWIRRGAAAWELKDGGRLAAGTDGFVLLPPFTPAWIHETRPGLVLHYCHFDFRPVPGRVQGALRRDGAGPGRDVPVPLSFSRPRAPGVARAYRALARIEPGRPESPWRVERAVLELIAELARFARRRAKRSGGGRLLEPAAPLDARVTQLCRRIDAEPARAWKVAELARSVDLSPGHVHAIFHRTLGRSLKRYIVEARLRRALKLLKERPGGFAPSVREVSERCGFASQHYFSRQFKAHFRIGPLAYRNGASLA